MTSKMFSTMFRVGVGLLLVSAPFVRSAASTEPPIPPPPSPAADAVSTVAPSVPVTAMSREERLKQALETRRKLLQKAHVGQPVPEEVSGTPVPAALNAASPPATQVRPQALTAPATPPKPSLLFSGDFRYTAIADGPATITGFRKDYSGALSIPSTLDGHPVTSIAGDAFSGCSGLISITIPDSVTNFKYAVPFSGPFSGCTKLTVITVDERNPAYSSVDGMLLDKKRTKLIRCPQGRTGQVKVPVGVVSISGFAFSGCPGLTDVTIPASVTNIDGGALLFLSGLTNFTVDPANPAYSSIDGILFNKEHTTLIKCPAGKVGKASVPASVTKIWDSAFISCTSLTAITVDDRNSTFGSEGGMLFDKSRTKLIHCPRGFTGQVKVPEGVTSIGKSAFSECRQVTGVTISNSVTSIGDSAFSFCIGLTEVTIPDSVTIMGDGVFGACTNLASVTIGNGVTRIGDRVFLGCSGLTGVTIGNGVTSIGRSAFCDCTNLARVIIGNRVANIGDEAFQGCSSLTSVALPDSVTNIGNEAFWNCASLTNISLPDNVTRIGTLAFSGCRSLTGVTIPASVNKIESSPFCGCTNLTTVTVNERNSAYSSADGILFDKSKTTVIHCPARKAGQVNIPAGVTRIDFSAFSSCSSLIGVTIPDSVSCIDSSAFEGCTGLASVAIPASVTSIGDCAFWGCTGLAGVIIPASVTSIGKGPFGCCNMLTTITVDATNASYCDADGILFNKGKTELIQYPGGRAGSYTIPAGVTSISEWALASCANLKDIKVESANPSYGSIDGFLCNKNLTTLIQCPAGKVGTIVIPQSVTNIGDLAFWNCTSLTGIVFPPSVAKIGLTPFSGCVKLTELCFKGNSPIVDFRGPGKDNNAIVYYLPDTTGWGKEFGGRPTAVWDGKMPVAKPAAAK